MEMKYFYGQNMSTRSKRTMSISANTWMLNKIHGRNDYNDCTYDVTKLIMVMMIQLLM